MTPEEKLEKLKSRLTVINSTTVVLVCGLLTLAISQCIKGEYWGAIFNFVLIGINGFLYYIRTRHCQCKTCGYFVVPLELDPKLAVNYTLNGPLHLGMCLKKWKEGWQMGELHHSKTCWKRPNSRKVLNSPEMKIWNEHLLEHKIQTKGW